MKNNRSTFFQPTFFKALFVLCFFQVLFISTSFCQTATLKGKVIDINTREAIPFANIMLQGTTQGATTDIEGNYQLESIVSGSYNVEVSVVGYEKQAIYELIITSAKPALQNFELNPTSTKIAEVEISVSRFEKNEESPLSKISIRSAEIIRNPGGNRDISKVLQSFPGVASPISFRNDIIVRGGAPNENRFYLDGIETPNINHFATQGSSGGPVGMINVNFINQVEFYTGAFPAGRGNALSSVLEFKQKNGNPDRIATNVMLGSSDIGLTLDGPISKKSDFIFSVRRSYLQLLFAALKLPFLPTYNDAQMKVNYYLDKKNTITLIGLGAVDQFKLNTKVNKGETDSATIERNNYLLGNLPVNSQWNYTIGLKYTHFSQHGFQNIIVSRNVLSNNAEKYNKNDSSDPANKILDYNSTETENKVRIENSIRRGNLKINYGLFFEQAVYYIKTFNQIFIPSGITTVDFSSTLKINKAGGFLQISKPFLKNKLILSGGLRLEANDYSAQMNHPFKQISPRLSASYQLSEKWYLNFNTGRYFQLPAYTVLGYRDSLGVLANKNNKVTFISADHFVSGLEYQPNQNTKIAVESFYKIYNNYPLLQNEQVSLANLGSDFGVIGNEPVTSTSKGRTSGAELLIQRTSLNGFYGIVAYTFVRSEFTNADNKYKVSSWDNRHILSLTGGKQLKKNWEIGVKFRYLSGTPYTPFDLNNSAVKSVWDISKKGILDYSQINTKRLPSTHQLDIRIDKKYYYKKSVFNFYLDIQNLYNRKTLSPSYLSVVTDSNGNPIEDPKDNTKYLLKEILNESGTILPSIGIMYEF